MDRHTVATRSTQETGRVHLASCVAPKGKAVVLREKKNRTDAVRKVFTYLIGRLQFARVTITIMCEIEM